MLNKSEMEEIWNSRSIGELKRINKNYKNQQHYKVSMRLWTKTWIEDQPEISVKVWAKDINKARAAAYSNLENQVRKHYPDIETRPNSVYEVEKISG
jgi:hypothetical protein